ncbi:Asp-tRNA(Asn)/Glu-tRNA(Gln) amidotransferase subunit GatA [Candidatus Wolfebacteria bacterium]|nr:Asp-tRNA(Asn)/Glu-tRNA(Gln) amidotransferase subunit GatA [Candidatus Wolfebacteria bacterium]
MGIQELTIKKFHYGLVGKKFSAVELTQEFLKAIEDRDAEIGAYLRTMKDGALRQASAVDVAVAEGQSIHLLAGAPLAIKDNILVERELATAGSKILENYTASYDATVIKKLKAARAVFLGKTNMDEFAMGSSTENSAFQITKNPHDLERVPGGSSGGSASAVAAGLAVAALGSDTGGSIRQPAAFCGVVGLKPTYGAVSRSGLIAMTSSLDQIGPITKTVEDARILFDAIRGKDLLDATSSNQPLTTNHLRLNEVVIGLPKEYFVDGLDAVTQKKIDESISNLKKLGIAIKEVSLPHTKYALSTYYIIMFAEVSANLARFDGIRYSRINADQTPIKSDISENRRRNPRKSALNEIYFSHRGMGFGLEPKRRILLGTFVLSHGYYDAYYAKAQKVRRLIREDFDKAFDSGVNAILAPVSPTVAFKIGEKTNDPLAMYLSDIFTIPVNLAGLPALSLPTQNDAERNAELRRSPRESASSPRQSASLPVGFQLIGKPFGEYDILSIGEVYERESLGV